MTHSWLAYLPPHLAADLLAHPTTSPLDRVLRQQAVALFADISGFTPMSEALGNVGPKGTEELSQILNRTFGSMIRIIQAYGGSIGKFAGDALTIVFPYHGRVKQPTVRRAVQCALDMQAAMAQATKHPTTAGVFHLTMKIGLGLGDLLTTTVGDATIRLEYLIAGSALDTCAAAEHHTPAGAIGLADALLPLLGQATTRPLSAGYHQVVQLHRRPALVVSPPLPDPTPTQVALLRRYLPPAIAERVARDQQGFIDEHRTVTTLFVRFEGVVYSERAALTRLQSYFSSVVHTIDQYGGYLRQIDVGDKGSLFIVLFGAPISHEDDAARALQCAWDLRTLAQQHDLLTTTGITTGRIFCGLVGTDIRREYAAIGDSVNLAARLMSAAPSDYIFVDLPTRQAVMLPFQWKELSPLTVKGKSVPIAVAALEDRRHVSPTRLRGPGYTLPMVGRTEELTRCLQLVMQAHQGHGQIIGITAEAGMGKTRLVAELLRVPTIKQLRYLTSECLSYGTNSSYLVWEPLLRALFNLTAEMTLDTQHQHVTAMLATIDPAFIARLPLLNIVLNLSFPETDLTRSMETKLRKESLEQLIVACIRHWAQQHPLLLILEDCHWIDDLSRDLLCALALQVTDIPLMLLITYRPFMTGQSITTALLGGVRRLPHYQELALTSFSRDETQQLINLKLKQLFGQAQQVPEVLFERIVEHAHGTPFYIDELLTFLHERSINIHDPQALQQLALPESLERLILSRIDQLAESPKTILKLASIIGRLFRAAWLWQIDPQVGGMAQVQVDLAQLQQHDLTQLERSEPEVEYLFKHIITREVAYQSLTFATRAHLHERVGALIERIYGTEQERWLDVLAYHYGNSSNMDKQREYFRKAGDAAAAAYANAAAISYYERVLPLLSGADQVEVRLALAQVQIYSSAWQQAEANLQDALTLAEFLGDQCLQGHCLRLWGEVKFYMGMGRPALPYLEAARERFTAIGEQHALMNTLRDLGYPLLILGMYEEALAVLQQASQLASALDNQMDLCTIAMQVSSVYQAMGAYADAVSWCERGIVVATTNNYLAQLQALYAAVALTYRDLAQYPRALDALIQSLVLAQQLGYTTFIPPALTNMGSIYMRVGQYTDAEICLQQSILSGGAVASPAVLSWSLNRLAICVAGRAMESEQLFARGVALCRALETPRPLAIFLYERAYARFRRGQFAQAQVDVDEARTLADQVGLAPIRLAARLLSLRVGVAHGTWPAEEAVAAAEVLRPDWSAQQDQALIAYTIWQLAPQREAERRAAAAIYRTLALQTGDVDYRERYTELTAKCIPALPQLPAPPTNVPRALVPIEVLLARADQVLSMLGQDL